MANVDRIIDLLHEAKARPAGAERERFLTEACGDDAPLKEQIVSLLEADADEGKSDFLKINRILRPVVLPAEKPGDRIGRYKLLEQIGEGGCGVVYMAEQQEPVRRRVALKVIKLGMDTKQVIARFEAERQALAMMDHPNIAKVLDGGATETGRPFFVMELVRGIKITEYCDQNNLSTNKRLELFMQVCQAIQHAHQKGIIHRDIKPSNILVTHHDDVAVPKVIDFGIAKATIGQLTDKTVFTAFAQFIGTPAYMSPEQAQMSGLDIDTRADIYSLGVLLYELLTGNTPFDAKELLAAGMDEMRRKIREDEPAKPSTCLSTMTAINLTTVAKLRHVEPPRLIHLIRGDLDWLVMKCLEKDRTRRYDTANGLAMDIRRHLNNEPVTACPPSRWYEFQKTVRRHKFGFAAAAALILVLGLGVLASTWQAIRAMHAEREQSRLRQEAEASQTKSETEAAKATAISDFLQQLLSSANPDALKGSDYTVGQLLYDFSAGIADQLQNQPEVEAAVRATIGTAYRRLGDADKAMAHHERVLTLRRHLFGDDDERVAESLVDYSWSFFEAGQYARGEPYVREALDIYRRRGTVGQPVISALWVLQKILAPQSRFAELEAVTDEAVVIAGKSNGVEFPDLASMLHGLAEMKNGQLKYAEAEALASRAVEMHRRLRSVEHPEVAWALLGLAFAQSNQAKLPEAEAALREALRIFRKYYSAGHKSVVITTHNLKSVLESRGDSAALEALSGQQFEDANQRVQRNEADAEAWMERALGQASIKLWKAATADSAEAVERSMDAAAATRAAIAANCLVLAQRAFAAAQYETAERASQQAIIVFRQLVQENPQGTDYPLGLGHSQWLLAQVLQNTRRPDQAEQVFLEALRVFEKGARDFPDVPYFRLEQAFSHRLLGDVVKVPGRVDEAVRHYRAAIEIYGALAAAVPQNAFYRQEQAYTTGALASLLERAGRSEAAVVEYRRALVLYEQAIENYPEDVVLRTRLVDLLRSRGKLAEAGTVRKLALTFQAAVTRYEKLASERNRHDECWRFAGEYEALGQLFQQLGQSQEAEKAYRDTQVLWRILVAGFNLEDDRWHLAINYDLLGQLLKEAGRLEEAIRVLRQALDVWKQLVVEFNMDDRRTHLSWTAVSLAATLQTLGKPAEAERVYRDALAAYAKTPGIGGAGYPLVFQSLIELLKSENRLAEVATLYRDELALQTKRLGDGDPQVRIQLGTLYRDTGEVDKAIAEFSWVLAQDPKRAEVWDLRGNCYLRKNELAKAVADYSRALELKPRVGWYWHERAYAHLMLGQHAQAIADHSASIEISDLDFGQRLRRGQSYEALGELEKAEADYARASKLNPADALAIQSLVRLLKSADKLAEAETQLKVLLAQQRQSPGEPPFVVALTLLQLADVLQAQNKAEAATNHFREALAVVSSARVDATNANSVNEMSWGLATGQKPTSWDAAVAVELAQKAVAATNRKNPMVLDSLAAAYAAVGQFTNAVPVQREAIVLLQDEKQKKDYTSRLVLYQAGIPYRNYATLEQQARTLHDQGKLAEAEAAYRELLPVLRKLSADDPQLAGTLAGLTQTLLAGQKFADAEPPARECLGIRETKLPDDWRTFNARSMLGGSLLGQKKYAEAEPLLLSGYEGMQQREDKIPAVGKPRLKETLQRLAQLYEATDQSEKAEEWNRKLAEFDQAEAGKKAAAAKP